MNIAYNRIKNGGVMMDALRKEDSYTIEDIYALPDGQRAELIDGKIYYMAPPSWKHQRISGRLYQSIANYIDSKNGKCEVLAAPFAVFLNEDDINYLEPDISVICDQSKLDEKGCHGAPDWVIEIVSPSSKPRDYMTKLFKYRTAGVREYWIVDPDKQMTTVYGFEKDMVEKYDFNEQSIINNIIRNRKHGKKHHIIVNAEGIGHSTSMARRIEAATGIETRATILGYMQRGGSPTCKDRFYASIMGAYAADLLCGGKSNRVVGYRNAEFVDFDIEEALAMKKEISEYQFNVSKLLSQ